ncbi:MAG TPA: glycoside hydrolase family 2 TIM barrel-domain containing protein, partial [Planctomycetota bacterium]|nr:glycoside hydrolase family 2 TIM barrel-domain containing protein [Planctomycetota bacterium]
ASVRDETFGLREIAIKDGHLHLNGKPVALFGYTGVGAYFQFNLIADTAALKTYQVDRLKQLNGIAFRCHQNPLLRSWLDLCDRNGILVLCEFDNFPDTQIQPTDTIENPYDRPGYWANFKREAAGLVSDRFNHPSIVMWSATNEGNGFSDWERANLYPFVKQQDSTRPVIFSSDVTPDVADTHNFCGNWWGTQADFDRIEGDMAATYKDRLYGCTEFGQYQFGANFYGEKARDKTRPPEYERDFGQLLMEQIETLRRLRSGLILPFCVPYRPPQGNADNTPFVPNEQFEAMRQAYAPLGLSLNTNNRHAVAGTEITLPVWIYSDAENTGGDVNISLVLLDKHPGFGWDGKKLEGVAVLASATATTKLPAWGCVQQDLKLKLPAAPVAGVLAAVLTYADQAPAPVMAISFRPLSTYAPLPKPAKPLVVEVLESGTAISAWLKARGHTVEPLMTEKKPDVIVIGEDMLTSGYLRMYQFMTLMRVKNGARLVILEQPRWNTSAFANDMLNGLEANPTRGSVEALFPDTAVEALFGTAADYRRLNGLEGIALRTGLTPPPPVAAAPAPEKIPTGQLPMPKETPAAPATPANPTTPAPTPVPAPAPAPTAPPAAPAAGAPGHPPIPGSIPPAAGPWKTWLAGYSHGLKKPDIAVACRTWEQGEVIACQVPLSTRLDAANHPSDYDPVVERLLQVLIESPRQPATPPAAATTPAP